MSEGSDGMDRGDRAAPRKRRRRPDTPALKPGSSSASPPPSVTVDKPGGRRARIEAVRAAMAANDAKREAERG